uniref:Uncharacterized protein n=1 Tax=Aegilops tauschii TaxID=37682 RepID=M8BNL1_AEGTA
MTREGCEYVDEVCVAPNEIHYHAGATYCFFNDRHALLEIHDVVVELQSITSAACLSLQQKALAFPANASSYHASHVCPHLCSSIRVQMSCECSLTRVVKPMDKRLFDGERIYARGDYLKCARMAAVKQEEVDTANDTSGGQITHDEPLCRKHNKRHEYIHRPRKASLIQKFKGKKIHLKPGKSILRVTNLYNCFQYFNVHFSTGSLFPHMNADHGELPITTGDGTTTVTVRFIKGVDKRATITKGWSDFFRRTHMNEGQAYAFGFKCTSKGLRLIVYSI